MYVSAVAVRVRLPLFPVEFVPAYRFTLSILRIFPLTLILLFLETLESVAADAPPTAAPCTSAVVFIFTFVVSLDASVISPSAF